MSDDNHKTSQESPSSRKTSTAATPTRPSPTTTSSDNLSNTPSMSSSSSSSTKIMSLSSSGQPNEQTSPNNTSDVGFEPKPNLPSVNELASCTPTTSTVDQIISESQGENNISINGLEETNSFQENAEYRRSFQNFATTVKRSEGYETTVKMSESNKVINVVSGSLLDNTKNGETMEKDFTGFTETVETLSIAADNTADDNTAADNTADDNTADDNTADDDDSTHERCQISNGMCLIEDGKMRVYNEGTQRDDDDDDDGDEEEEEKEDEATCGKPSVLEDVVGNVAARDMLCCSEQTQAERNKGPGLDVVVPTASIGPDGLVDIYHLGEIKGSTRRQLNVVLDNYRSSQQTIQKLCSYINQLKREIGVVKQATQKSQDGIQALQQEIGHQRRVLAAACVPDVKTVKKDSRLQRLVPKCYDQYLTITDDKEANRLLHLIRNKKNSLSQLETLVLRKRLVLKHALPVTINQSDGSKMPVVKKSKQTGYAGTVSSSKQRSKVTMQPVVVEILSRLPDSGSASWTTESCDLPTSSSLSHGGRGSSSTPSTYIHSTESDDVSIMTRI